MNEAFYQRLSRLRKEKNISASEMARLIDIAPTTYREWEYGRNQKLPPFLKISQVLAISVAELITGTVTPPSKTAEDIQQIEEKLRHIRLNLVSMK